MIVHKNHQLVLISTHAFPCIVAILFSFISITPLKYVMWCCMPPTKLYMLSSVRFYLVRQDPLALRRVQYHDVAGFTNLSVLSNSFEWVWQVFSSVLPYLISKHHEILDYCLTQRESWGDWASRSSLSFCGAKKTGLPCSKEVSFRLSFKTFHSC